MIGRFRRAGRNHKRSERGQSFVELALALPLLMVLIFAVIEFGLVIADQVTIIHAAADGARVGARADSPTNKGYAQTQANSHLGDLNRCPSPTVSVTYDEQIPDMVHVTVSCVYSPLTPLGSLITMIGGSLNLTPTISATSVMRVQ